MITQELLKEHFEYRDGHLWWIKPTGNKVKIGQAYRKATEHLHKEYANYG